MQVPFPGRSRNFWIPYGAGLSAAVADRFGVEKMSARIVFAALALICALVDSATAEVAAVNAVEYRLNLAHPGTFRLAAKESAMPPPEPRPDYTTPARLIDRPFAKLIEAAAREAALEPALVHAIISVESGYNSVARSPKGAIGLMQVMPETASRYGVPDAAHSPAANLRAGTRYLSELMDLFDNRIELVLAAYNAGENAVLRHGQRVPPYRETQLYVPAVLARFREWQEPTPAPDPAPSSTRIRYMPGTVLDLNSARASVARGNEIRP